MRRNKVIKRVILFAILVIFTYIFAIRVEEKNIEYKISELIEKVNENIINTEINYENCEQICITPSYEWLIKEVANVSVSDANNIVEDIVNSFSIKDKESSQFDIIEMRINKYEQELEYINDKMFNSLRIGSEIYELSCDQKFENIREVYKAIGKAEYKEKSDDFIEFECMIVAIAEEYYILEYSTK